MWMRNISNCICMHVCDIFWNTIGRFEAENCNDEPNHNYEKESFKRYFSISYKNTMCYIQDTI